MGTQDKVFSAPLGEPEERHRTPEIAKTLAAATSETVRRDERTD
jgi:hypothetical protein